MCKYFGVTHKRPIGLEPKIYKNINIFEHFGELTFFDDVIAKAHELYTQKKAANIKNIYVSIQRSLLDNIILRFV